jgi:hypothetical protein
MNRKEVEQKAMGIAQRTFNNATMRGMLYDSIVDAFCPSPEYPPTGADGRDRWGQKVVNGSCSHGVPACEGCVGKNLG